MGFNQLAFDEALKRKYEIMGQNANADTTRANAAAQDVSQKPVMQQQTDAAAMARARLGADTSLQATGMTNDSLMDRAKLAAQTQTGIAGMENQLGRDKMNQQNQQFGQTLQLDTAKAQESSLLERAKLTQPEFGRPIVTDPAAGTTVNWTKHPGLNSSDIGKSPLDSLNSSGVPDWAKKRLSGQSSFSQQ